ncbi:lytic murein transglycosylase [Alteromonas sp. 5E99-2]|uniref:lytic murein transglycosylase n=1 Tax=Alteromonas sp. 5E99-2 TaxID=2817683 RepID=UPI001A994FC7|nr:lytic murein transglycosylase [Alteromonas sp. 5E99-2]MBO1255146.1 lytic murein transglycosylase [Alteromonas sp. 5E99-2]
MKKGVTLWICFVSFYLFSSNVFAQNEAEFALYVEQLFIEAKEKGFSEDILTQAKASIAFRPTVVKADKSQPEKRITLSDYLSTRVPDWKVEQAVSLYQTHKELIKQVEQDFGVQGRFIVALWGNESNFGKIQGKHPVLSSLASLAFEGRRETLFKTQFFAALTILQEGHINLEAFNGSWAGAMGQSQFMPTNFLAYAVDYDNDGKKDIWNSVPDVLASIANFLKQHGWNDEYTWGRQVDASAVTDSSIVGLDKRLSKPIHTWGEFNVTRYDGQPLPNVPIKAWLLMPDGETGRHYLVYDNFQTLMRWNRSSYFGISVSYLSERIKKGL